MFERIKNDKFIQDCYVKADDPNLECGFWVYHGFNHINNVIEMVEKILIQLEYDEEYIENAKIAALLHDIGMVEGKDGHAKKSYEMAKQYFKDNNIYLKYEEEVLTAIKSHRDDFDSNDIMTLVLILADKIDIKKTRLAPEGYHIDGLNQYQYINDINIFKDDNNFTVQFLIDDACDKDKIEDWYFTAKVFKAIEGFANHFNFDLKILWNDSEWKMGK